MSVDPLMDLVARPIGAVRRTWGGTVEHCAGHQGASGSPSGDMHAVVILAPDVTEHALGEYPSWRVVKGPQDRFY